MKLMKKNKLICDSYTTLWSSSNRYHENIQGKNIFISLEFMISSFGKVCQ